MKKISIDRKRWLDRHSRPFSYGKKDLTRKCKPRLRHEDKYRFDEHDNLIYHQPTKAKKDLKYHLAKGHRKILVAPKNFSLYLNPDETLGYIETIVKTVIDGMPIRIGMDPVKVLSIDTIMYFLAILKRLKLSGVNYSFEGSTPEDEESKHLLRSCGFFNYVHTRGRHGDLAYESDMVKIVSGQNADPEIVKKLCNFVISKLALKRTDTFKLYNMIMELMANTKQHAYFHQRSEYVHEWYIFVYYLRDNKSVRFIFLDTGSGIPSTIQKYGWEVAAALFDMGSHTEYIRSAVEGELRSRTGEMFRGNGLPTINSFCNKGYIKDLTIISNRGYFAAHRKDDMKLALKGTLFYWEMFNGTEVENKNS